MCGTGMQHEPVDADTRKSKSRNSGRAAHKPPIALQWDARQLVDHAVKLGCRSVFITDFAPLRGATDDDALGQIRGYAADRGIHLVLGLWSICPSSRTFKQDWGAADEHLALGIRRAQALGSPVFRVILGNRSDRLTDGGIEARITDMLAVLKRARSRAVDASEKIAVGNHAGDMQSHELRRLVEEAGPEFIGVNVDSGNACWTLEDPVRALTTLAPYVVTTSLRDTMTWESPEGVTTQWTALGDGCTDLPALFDRLAAPAEGRAAVEQHYQRAELERSIRHCHDVLGLG